MGPTQKHNKVILDYVEFYIAHSCNFNCQGCNRFNNYNFTGTQQWVDYADIYKQWAELIDIKECTVLGGEPMMNKSYLNWLTGIHCFWPNTKIKFLTNGSLLTPQHQELYDIIRGSNQQIQLSIGLHNGSRRDDILDTCIKWLKGKVKIHRTPENLVDLPEFDKNWKIAYNQIRDPSWPECNTVDQWLALPNSIRQECAQVHNFTPEILGERLRNYLLEDSNGVQVLCVPNNQFHQAAVIPNSKTQSFSLHNSDPTQAHDNCDQKYCHHFIQGQLYKCGVVGILPDFYQQFNMELSKADVQLIHNYNSGTVDMPNLNRFINKLKNVIPQCKFCPEHYTSNEIYAESKKIIFKRKI